MVSYKVFVPAIADETMPGLVKEHGVECANVNAITGLEHGATSDWLCFLVEISKTLFLTRLAARPSSADALLNPERRT
jgi:hypothetical protein